MKRSDALAPLSRQHHQGLFTAMKLKRADAAGAAEARAAFVDCWEREGRGHFRVEEEVLFPLIEEALPPDELARLAHETGHA